MGAFLGRVVCCTEETLSRLRVDAIADQGRIRYWAFKDKGLLLTLDHALQIEKDQYDRPSAIYLVYYDDGNRPVACTRLITVHEKFESGGQEYLSMIQDFFHASAPEERQLMYPNGNLSAIYVREMTRIAVMPEFLTPEKTAERRHAVSQLVVAMFELAKNPQVLHHTLPERFEIISAIMSPKLWKSIFEDRGCATYRIGEGKVLPGDGLTEARMIQTNHHDLRKLRKLTDITKS